MTPNDSPSPQMQEALRHLNSRQLEFCRLLIAGSTGVAAYRAAYGAERSGCHRRAAAKIKRGAAVRRYLDVWRTERHQKILAGRGTCQGRPPEIPAPAKRCHLLSAGPSGISSATKVIPPEQQPPEHRYIRPAIIDLTK